MRALLVSISVSAVLVSTSLGQTPIPVIVPAMTPAKTVQSPAATAITSTATSATLKALQAMKAANDEILKQQEATLLKLDEMEKTAQEMRIYSKRG